MNLSANASDALETSEGNIPVEVRALSFERDYRDRCLQLEKGFYAVLSVSHTGHGIHARDIERIFDPFFTTNGWNRGTGLGLSVVFSSMRKWGGHVSVASVPGKARRSICTFLVKSMRSRRQTPAGSTCLKLHERVEAVQWTLRRDLSTLGCGTLLVDEGVTLTVAVENDSRGLQICSLSPRLMKQLVLLTEGIVALAAPFSRGELARGLSALTPLMSL